MILEVFTLILEVFKLIPDLFKLILDVFTLILDVRERQKGANLCQKGYIWVSPKICVKKTIIRIIIYM